MNSLLKSDTKHIADEIIMKNIKYSGNKLVSMPVTCAFTHSSNVYWVLFSMTSENPFTRDTLVLARDFVNTTVVIDHIGSWGNVRS